MKINILNPYLAHCVAINRSSRNPRAAGRKDIGSSICLLLIVAIMTPGRRDRMSPQETRGHPHGPPMMMGGDGDAAVLYSTHV